MVDIRLVYYIGFAFTFLDLLCAVKNHYKQIINKTFLFVLVCSLFWPLVFVYDIIVNLIYLLFEKPQ